MERRVLKKDGKCYVELPSDFSQHESLELFPLRSGFYLLTLPLSKKSKPHLTEEEKSVLRKLSRIKFEKRIPPYVEKALNPEEKQILSTLLTKGYVNLFKSKKYRYGVYNIRDSVYPLLTSRSNTRTQGTDTPFLSQGYAVIDNARFASQISDQLRKQGKSKTVVGVKGFDGRFYMVTKSYFSKTAPIVLKALSQPKSSDSVAKLCQLPSSACLAILRVLSEEGDVVEKRKGIFVRA